MRSQMRWDDQRVDNDEGRLPGVGDGTVVRTFDAPEATGINFHEVRAKSALNHVPGTRYGFNWTINPFRGCSHACVYCLSGDTPVLLTDGRTRAIAELEVGESIYGTIRRGSYRHYTATSVLAHWQTLKPGYRIALEDGTELIASADHRFLTERGWKFVTGAENGSKRRPHLTLDNKLMGFGGVCRTPPSTDEYRRGYLFGMLRGDGHIGSYEYPTAGRVHRFRLALADPEALNRSRVFLEQEGVPTTEFAFHPGGLTRRPITAIRTSGYEGLSRARRLASDTLPRSDQWLRGFLAGIFDAEGCCSGDLRISNRDEQLLALAVEALRRYGFAVTLEPARPNGVRSVRLLGGLAAQQRFFEAVDPAITRKRSIEGIAIESRRRLGVVAIEPVGTDIEMYDITTGTGDFIANGVVSHNCFARRTHTYLGFDAGRDFEKEIVVKVNTPEVLRAELKRPSWKGELVALGTNTDPYQWAEGRYRFMPEIIEALEEADTPITVLTKSPLVLRDIDLYARMAEHLDVTVNLSIPTLDEKAWRATEPHTPSPKARLEAVAELKRRGIGSGVLVAPLMPGINDAPEQVEPLVDAAREAGADFLGGIALHLRDGVRDVFFGWLNAKRPDLIPRYEELYAGGRAYQRAEDAKETTRAVGGWGRSGASRRRRSATAKPRRETAPSSPAESEQTSLF